MNIQNHNFFFERTQKRTEGQAQSNMPLQLYESWGHKKIKQILEYISVQRLTSSPLLFFISLHTFPPFTQEC